MCMNKPNFKFVICYVREASHINFVHKKCHMDVFPTPPHPSLETSRTSFNSVKASEALLILHALKLSVVYESINVHLGQSQDLIMSIKIYLKYKYTYKNTGFCILCIDDFKILKFFNKLSKFSTNFYRKTSQPPTPTPTVYVTFFVDKIDM